MEAPRVPFTVALALVLAAGVAFYVWKKGGLSNAAKGAGAAVVNAAGAAASGAVGAVSQAVNIPTPDDTTTDPLVARWVIDRAGVWEASFWCGVPALLAAAKLEPGTGRAPPAGSAIAKAFPGESASYDESGRLLQNHPAYEKAAPVVDVWDLQTWGLGL